MTDLVEFADQQNESWASSFEKTAAAIEACIPGWTESHDPESLFKAAQVAQTARVWREAARALRQPAAIRAERAAMDTLQ
jgi:hypothetical protein